MAEINRMVWEKGDFGAVAPMGWDVGGVVLGHVGVEQGERVLDVACGTGNAAIRAAQRGGTVTGLDIVPALLDQGRALAAEAGVEVEFMEGDEGHVLRLLAGELQVQPRSREQLAHVVLASPQDRRLEAFGRRRHVARGDLVELPRQALRRPAGDGDPAIRPQHAGDLGRGALVVGDEHAAERGEDDVEARVLEAEVLDSAEEGVSLMETKFGPVVTAKQALEPEGKWEALRAEMVAFFDEHRDDGVEYLLVTGTKRG